ncbi:MAG: hypothetical protein DRN25_01175 [Thermoplasmata archaeon]|nr:MAG: hypothetical protein DRN25_01175 [Thermoplasmata archaeon]
MGKLPTQSSIDILLDGGIETGILTQIYGEAGSGKSCLCLQILINCVKSGKKAVLIDTEGSLDRLKQLSKEYFEDIIKKIRFYKPSNFKDQDFIIKNLKDIINQEYSLIIIDSILSFYHPTIKFNKVLNSQLKELSFLAEKYKVAVVITSPYPFSLLNYWSKTIIELKKINSFREAILIRHRKLKEGKKIKFTIGENGIKDA